VEIKLSNLDTTFVPGQEISGEVVVHSPPAEHKREPASLECRWHTHGRGNRDAASVSQDILVDEREDPDGTLRYPFKVRAPQGPFTYHGKNLNVEWMLRAEIPIAWAIDPKAEVGFGLVPGADPGSPPPELIERFALLEQSKPSRNMGCGIAAGLFFTILPLMHLTVGITLFREGAPGVLSLVFSIVPLIFMGVGLAIIFLSMRNWLAQRKLGAVSFELDPPRPHLGEELRCRLHLNPHQKTRINEATMKVRCEEVCVRGSGTNKQTFRTTLYETATPLIDGTMDLEPNLPMTRRAGVVIPPELPAAFNASDNQIEWTCEVHVDVAGWPDWLDKRQMLVWPGATSSMELG